MVQEHFERIVVSTQVLGECFNVLTRKISKPAEEATQIVSDIMSGFEVMNIQKVTVAHALELHAQYHFSYYDSLILASALEAGCSIVYTEDMQHGQLIEQTLTIQNPYTETVSSD